MSQRKRTGSSWFRKSTGTRTETVPFDRTGQLYQSQRAVIDARDRAGKAVAGQIELEIARALTKAGV